MSLLVCALFFLLAVSAKNYCTGSCREYDTEAKMNRKHDNPMHHKMKFWESCAAEHQCPFAAPNLGFTPCENGKAGEYPCQNVDILSFVNLASLGSKGDGNDVWGWTDPLDNKEYAISAVWDGTSFVDITDPRNPHVLGFLPTHTVGSNWRDVKVYKDHAFIISEAYNHGMQVFDLKQLRNLPRVSLDFVNQTINNIPKLKETAFYGQFGSAHNIVINEDTGFAYVVGSKTCRSGLHIVDIKKPVEPEFVSCYADDGYVHDAQCVIYDGPDKRYTGQEICFCYDEDTLTIVDVTDKKKFVTISRTDYKDTQYTHQGWLLPGMSHLLLNDELDELRGVEKTTRTLVWDVVDLKKPVHKSSYMAKDRSIDHNLYTLGKYAYLANYCAGLRVLDTSKVGTTNVLEETAFLDVAPNCNTVKFLGSWSVYPYFPSGTVVVNTIDRGLFMVKVHLK